MLYMKFCSLCGHWEIFPMHRSGLIMELALLFLSSQGLQSCMVFHHYLKIVASDISPSFIVYWEIGIIYILSLMEASVDFASVLERRNLKRFINYLFLFIYVNMLYLFLAPLFPIPSPSTDLWCFRGILP